MTGEYLFALKLVKYADWLVLNMNDKACLSSKNVFVITEKSAFRTANLLYDMVQSDLYVKGEERQLDVVLELGCLPQNH